MTETSCRDIAPPKAAEFHEAPHEPSQPRQRRRGPSPLAILFLAANPANTSQLALDEEARAIGAKLRRGGAPNSPRFATRWAVRRKDLQEALLEERPTLVHFSGHGSGDDGLVFHDDDGAFKAVSADALRELFSVFRDDIQVVVLSACYSAAQGQAIASEVDVVIGMRSAVTDRAAILFSEAFYQALTFGRSVGTAFDLGVNAIKLDGATRDAENPVLLQRPGVDAHALEFATDVARSQVRRILAAGALAVTMLAATAYLVFRSPGPPSATPFPAAGVYLCEAEGRPMVGCAIEEQSGQHRIAFATPEDNGVLVHRMEGVLVASSAGCWTAVIETVFSDGTSVPKRQPGGTIACCRSNAGWSGHWVAADESRQLGFTLVRGKR